MKPTISRAFSVALALGLFAAPAGAGGSTRSLGLGEASIAVPDPTLLGRDNPAFLGVTTGRGLRIGVVDLAVEAGNSALSLSDYTRFNGAELTEEEEEEILRLLGGEDWTMAARAVGHGPAVAYGPLALAVRGVGGGGGRIPYDVLELVFRGNTTQEVVDVSATGGGGWAAVEARAAFGRSIGPIAGGGQTTIGVAARVLRGFSSAEVVHSEGQLVTRPDTLYGSARFDLRTAEAGSGVALDLGAVHNRGALNVGLRVQGLVGSMRWTGAPTLRRFEAEATTPDFLDQATGGGDVIATSDTTFAIGAFTTRLPLRVGLGVAGELARFLVAADLEHTADGRGTDEDPWRLSLGVERGLLGGRLSPRVGAVLGGTAGPSLGGGLSVALGPWRLDLDAATYRTTNPFDPRGARFALGTSFVIG